MPVPSTDLIPLSIPDVAIRALVEGQSVQAALELVQQTPGGNLVRRVPAPMALTEVQRAALTQLPEKFGEVSPQTARALAPAEREKLLAERDLIDALLTLDARKKAIRDLFATDLDIEAERTGTAVPEERIEADRVILATRRDEDGHYLLAGEVAVPGTDRRMVRTVNRGTLTVNVDLLEQQVNAGRITSEQFERLTRTVRVYDESGARSAIIRDPELLLAVREATVETKAPHATVQPR